MAFRYLTLALAALSTAAHAAYVQKTPPLATPWTSNVSLTNPLPEYPRPQLVRRDWQSLNGPWEFAAAAQITSPPTGQTLAETVLVPFPLESALSGIMRHETHSFYRRTFTVPAAWAARRVILNFGAVTWQATVWVNGKEVGTHSGGYEAFSFDITPLLKPGKGAVNEIIVGVYSPVDSAGIPVGKQRLSGSGIYYTAASGIWQTVWLEPAPAARITQLDTTPDIQAGVLNLVVKTSAGAKGLVTAVVSSKGVTVGTATAAVGKPLRISVPNARLWSPDDPFLYDLRVSLSTGDVVTGYFGMRSIGTAVVNGWLRPVLNGRFIFTMGTLDQGYWPDGIYTAPTDEALVFDLERQKALGFNTVRKHIKVEPARWFYHADRLGLLVFQDMPATSGPLSAADKKNFEDELRRMIDQLRGITSIVQWIPFNEGWGEYEESRITTLTKSFDATRPVNGNSGSNCCGRDPGNGDVVDDHIYVGPGNTHTPNANRFAQLGEFGGIGLKVAGHEWQPGKGFSYEVVADAAAYNRRYVEVSATLQGLIWGRGLSGSIYTEPTDVENEVNGYYTYDRQVLKGNFDQLKAVHLAVLNSVAWLRAGESISLGVTTPNLSNRYLRVVDSLGVTSTISDAASRQDTTFRVRAGLASSSCWSFESRNQPGRFLRHLNSRIRLDASTNTTAFKRDATFCLRVGGTKSGVRFESFSVPGKFLRHYDGKVYLASNRGGANPWDTKCSRAEDTTWQVASPWWRSRADIAPDARVSFQVTTAGLTDRYLRHQGALAVTSVASASSDAGTRADATFIARAGLADPGCYSFEASNAAGQFLRHSSFRLQIARNDGGDVFKRDATFCAQPGAAGEAEGITLQSFNIAGHNWRHYNAEVWIAIEGGPKNTDSATSYAADVTWRVAAPLDP